MPSAFAYDTALGAILVRQGDLLTYATFDGGTGQKKVVSPPNTAGGDWYVWCVYDDEDDVAIVVAAIRADHLDGIKERMGKIETSSVSM